MFVGEEDGSVDIQEEDDSLDIKEECMVKKDPLSTTSQSTKGKSKIVGLFKLLTEAYTFTLGLLTDSLTDLLQLVHLLSAIKMS